MAEIREIVLNAIDLHFHIGPEVIPRKYTAGTLAEAMRGRIGGFVLKSHYFPTVPLIRQAAVKDKPLLVGSITLNWPAGGLNPDAVRCAAELSPGPIVVWFPTISAKNYLDKSEFEVRPEWVDNPGFRPRLSKGIRGIIVLEEGNLTEEATAVLEAIKACKAVLATGHISWQESEALAAKALDMGIKVIITHPIYQLIDMPVQVQKSLADKGAFIEICYSMYSIDKIPIGRIASQIKAVGAGRCIISSDLGQRFSEDPDMALARFAQMLVDEGVTLEDIEVMLVANPRRIIA